MDIRPISDPPDPDKPNAGNRVPADAFSPVIDPDLIPGPSPEEEHATDGDDEPA